MKRSFIIPLIILSFLFYPPRVFAGEKLQDRFVSDRFIFIGSFNQKPLLATVTFERGQSEKGRFRYQSAFNGHFLFSERWHHLKNRIIEESPEIKPLEEIPVFKPCLVKFSDDGLSGAVNYDHQEIYFLLQFRNLKTIDIAGVRKDFTVKTSVADGVLQFQGNAVPGRVIYQRTDLSGYNPYVHRVDSLRRRNFNSFYLFDERGRFYIIWCEKEKVYGLGIPPRRMIEYEEKPAPMGESEAQGRFVTDYLEMEWLATEKETSPENQFREYPVEWKITAFPPADEKGRSREPINLKLKSTASFYWFNRGLFTVEGNLNGGGVFGLGEVIRGR